jgi:hypothetical protein
MLKLAEKLDDDLEKIDQNSQKSSKTKNNESATALDIHSEMTGNGSDSLLSLMTDFAEKLDQDFVQSSSSKVQQSSSSKVQQSSSSKVQVPIADTDPSLVSFLSKVADKMDTESQSTNPEATLKKTDGKWNWC